ncbi:MAG: hypothetical protein ACJAYB_000020 [Psychromonas sp.]|jgi:hypothetical protein
MVKPSRIFCYTKSINNLLRCYNLFRLKTVQGGRLLKVPVNPQIAFFLPAWAAQGLFLYRYAMSFFNPLFRNNQSCLHQLQPPKIQKLF